MSLLHMGGGLLSTLWAFFQFGFSLARSPEPDLLRVVTADDSSFSSFSDPLFPRSNPLS